MPSLKTREPNLDDPAIRFHALEREYGALDRWGFEMPLPEGTHLAMAKAILAVAGADGKVSQRERTFLLGRARMFGTSDEELQEIASFDPKSASFEKLIDDIPPAARRQVMFDAVLVARSDGYGEKERVAAVKAAERFGLSADFVDAVEAHLIVEEGVKEARIRLLTSPDA